MSYEQNGSFDVMDTIDPDFTQSFERNHGEPYFVAAECYTGCNDPWCPYTHSEGWKIDGLSSFYRTEMDALQAKLARG